MYRRGAVLHLPLRVAPIAGRAPRASTVAVVVEGVYARGDGAVLADYYIRVNTAPVRRSVAASAVDGSRYTADR